MKTQGYIHQNKLFEFLAHSIKIVATVIRLWLLWRCLLDWMRLPSPWDLWPGEDAQAVLRSWRNGPIFSGSLSCFPAVPK